jgi:hypothetical protein
MLRFLRTLRAFLRAVTTDPRPSPPLLPGPAGGASPPAPAAPPVPVHPLLEADLSFLHDPALAGNRWVFSPADRVELFANRDQLAPRGTPVTVEALALRWLRRHRAAPHGAMALWDQNNLYLLHYTGTA